MIYFPDHTLGARLESKASSQSGLGQSPKQGKLKKYENN